MDIRMREMPDVLIDLAKIVGGVIKDTIDIGDYRLTVIVEKKVDNNMGIVVDSLTVERRMSALEAGIIAKKLKDVLENRQYRGNTQKKG